MCAAQGLASRELSAKVMMPLRRRLLHAQRKLTDLRLPDFFVTRVVPASAATCRACSRLARQSPRSGEDLGGVDPAGRNRDMKIFESGCSSRQATTDRSRSLIAMLRRDARRPWPGPCRGRRGLGEFCDAGGGDMQPGDQLGTLNSGVELLKPVSWERCANDSRRGSPLCFRSSALQKMFRASGNRCSGCMF